MFKQKTKTVEIEYEGEKQTFHVRRASARDVLEAMEPGNSDTAVKRANQTLKMLVNQDGTPLKDDEREAILDAPWDAVTKITDAISEHSGLNKASATNPVDAAKKD